MEAFAVLLGIDPDVLKLLTAILSLIAATATLTTTVYGILNRRSRLRTEAAAVSTNAAVLRLATLLEEQAAERAALWKAYQEKDQVATPDGVRRIAENAAEQTARTALEPAAEFLAAWELVESRREHRPETDVILILEQKKAA